MGEIPVKELLDWVGTEEEKILGATFRVSALLESIHHSREKAWRDAADEKAFEAVLWGGLERVREQRRKCQSSGTQTYRSMCVKGDSGKSGKLDGEAELEQVVSFGGDDEYMEVGRRRGDRYESEGSGYKSYPSISARNGRGEGGSVTGDVDVEDVVCNVGVDESMCMEGKEGETVGIERDRSQEVTKEHDIEGMAEVEVNMLEGEKLISLDDLYWDTLDLENSKLVEWGTPTTGRECKVGGEEVNVGGGIVNVGGGIRTGNESQKRLISKEFSTTFDVVRLMDGLCSGTEVGESIGTSKVTNEVSSCEGRLGNTMMESAVYVQRPVQDELHVHNCDTRGKNVELEERGDGGNYAESRLERQRMAVPLGPGEELGTDGKDEEMVEMNKCEDEVEGNIMGGGYLKALYMVDVAQARERKMEGVGGMGNGPLDVLDDLSIEEREKLEIHDLVLGVGDNLYWKVNTGEGDDGYGIICESSCEMGNEQVRKLNVKVSLGEVVVNRLRKYLLPDKAILAYMFDSQVDSREVLVATDRVVLRRSHLETLKEGLLVDRRIVNGIVDLLTMYQHEVHGGKARYWWIPTTVSRPRRCGLGCVEEVQEWGPWVGPLSECEQIYLPVMAMKHWFVGVAIMAERTVYVFDNLRIPSAALGTTIVNDILTGMDIVFREEKKRLGKPEKWFEGFHIISTQTVVEQCIGKHCGIYVIKCMQSAFNNGGICNHGDNKLERECVALQLGLSKKNRVRALLVKNAMAASDVMT